MFSIKKYIVYLVLISRTDRTRKIIRHHISKDYKIKFFFKASRSGLPGANATRSVVLVNNEEQEVDNIPAKAIDKLLNIFLVFGSILFQSDNQYILYLRPPSQFHFSNLKFLLFQISGFCDFSYHAS